MNKFNRHFTLSVQAGDGGIVIIQNPLTLEFNIRRDTLASANTGNFRIHNLGELTRRRIYKDKFDVSTYRSIELRAGYVDNAPLVFKGNVKQAYNVREEGSTSFITEIEGFDGGFALVNSFSSFTMAAGTTKEEVVNRLIGDMKNVNKGAVSDFDGVFPRGRAIMGPTSELIKDETGGLFFIDNEKVYCLKNNDCIAGNILVISSETGLLGSPQRSDSLLIAEILFEPRLTVGQIVELISRDNPNYNGVYKVVGVEHSGIISDAVNGKCTTKVSLWFGTQALNLISGAA